jgi:hypothetical protein
VANPTRSNATKQAKPTGVARPATAARPTDEAQPTAATQPGQGISTTVVVASRGLVVGDAITLVGAAMAIVGALLPWEKANASQPLGLEFDDGKIFLFVAILTIVTSGSFLASRWLPPGIVGPAARLLGSGASLSVLTGGYVICFSILNLRDISSAVDRFNGLIGGSASVGPGIYLDLAAGVVIMVGAAIGLFLWHDRDETR